MNADDYTKADYNINDVKAVYIQELKLHFIV